MEGDSQATGRLAHANAERHYLTADRSGFVTEHARELYDLRRGFEEPAACVACLRVYDATKTHGGSDRKFCSLSCRLRADDPRRRALPTAWRKCVECGTPFFCLTVGGRRQKANGEWFTSPGKVLCPPAWTGGPGSAYWDKSPCWADHRRRTKRVHMAKHRERRPHLYGPAAINIWTMLNAQRPTLKVGIVAGKLRLTVVEVEAMEAAVDEWVNHLRRCDDCGKTWSPASRRLRHATGCGHVSRCDNYAHKHSPTLNRAMAKLADLERDEEPVEVPVALPPAHPPKRATAAPEVPEQPRPRPAPRPQRPQRAPKSQPRPRPAPRPLPRQEPQPEPQPQPQAGLLAGLKRFLEPVAPPAPSRVPRQGHAGDRHNLSNAPRYIDRLGSLYREVERLAPRGHKVRSGAVKGKTGMVAKLYDRSNEPTRFVGHGRTREEAVLDLRRKILAG